MTENRQKGLTPAISRAEHQVPECGTKLLLPKAIRMSAMTADILMFNTKAFPQKSAK
jgi:hypothetical protein